MPNANLPILQTKVLKLRNQTTGYIFGLDSFVDALILALLSATHVFIYGIRGIAKSHTISILVRGIDGVQYFHCDFSATTVPAELFGEPDYKVMREEGRRVRVGTGMAQEADLVYFNEAYRGGPAVHGATLMFLNERKHREGNKVYDIPLKTAIVDSNSIPEDPELQAHYDRLHQRVWLHELDDAELFVDMLLQDPFDVLPAITWDEMLQAQKEVQAVRMTKDAARALWDVRTELRDVHGIAPSPRHYKQSVDILRAQAWLEGRDEVLVEDLEVLSTVLPDNPGQQVAVDSVLIARCNPEHQEILELINGKQENGVLVGGWAQLAEVVEQTIATPKDTPENITFRNQQTEELTPKLAEAMAELKAVLAKPMSTKTHASAMRGKKLLVGTFFRAFEELHNLDRDIIEFKLGKLGFPADLLK